MYNGVKHYSGLHVATLHYNKKISSQNNDDNNITKINNNKLTNNTTTIHYVCPHTHTNNIRRYNKYRIKHKNQKSDFFPTLQHCNNVQYMYTC